MVDYLNSVRFSNRCAMSVAIAGFIRSKDRMIRRLTPCAKPNNCKVQVVATKRKIEEMEMLLDILRLTGAA